MSKAKVSERGQSRSVLANVSMRPSIDYLEEHVKRKTVAVRFSLSHRIKCMLPPWHAVVVLIG